MIFNIMQVTSTNNCIKISNITRENHQMYAQNATYSCTIAMLGLPTTSKKNALRFINKTSKEFAFLLINKSDKQLDCIVNQ